MHARARILEGNRDEHDTIKPNVSECGSTWDNGRSINLEWTNGRPEFGSKGELQNPGRLQRE
jgi:hypothetical protein